VVDATQGIEAQTVANAMMAMNANLEIVPLINKIDLPAAEPERVRGEIEDGRFINGVMQDDANNFVAFGYFIERMKAVYCDDGESVNKGVVRYLKTVCGVTDEEISAIRNILTK